MKLADLTTSVLLMCALTSVRVAHAQARSTPPLDPAVVRALAGCYALDLGAWSKPPTLGPASPTILVRLDTLPLYSGEPGGIFVAARLAPTDTASSRGLQPRAMWSLVPPDSVEVIPWSTGFEAEVFRGRRVGAELRGVVRRTNDVIYVDLATGREQWDAYPTAPATGRRVPCPPA